MNPNPTLAMVVAELHVARAALQDQGINARFDLEITDKGPRVSANVGSPIFEITKGLLPKGLKYVTVKIRPTSDQQPRIK